MSHFTLFSLPTAYAIDSGKLQSTYFDLQRQYHPDKAGLDGVQKSIELNQAYNTLGDPLKRAQYFLSLHGLDVGNDDSKVKPAMDLLEEMMEKREAVMELSTPEAAAALLEQAKADYEAELGRFSALAEDIENNKDKAPQSLLRLQYISKLQSEIAQQHKQLA